MSRALDHVSMADSPEGFRIERFEWMRATADLALLRVVGRWDLSRGGDPSRALLVAIVGKEVRHFSPLPPGAALTPRFARHEPQGLAFPVPLALMVEEDVRFSLRPAPDRLVALGAPTERPLGESEMSMPPADELGEWRRQVQEMIADGKELERRVVTLSRAIREHAGLHLPGKRAPALEPPEATADSLPRLREAVAAGWSRAAGLETRIAELERRFRSPWPGDQDADAGHGQRS